jgi:hypothetical protein
LHGEVTITAFLQTYSDGRIIRAPDTSKHVFLSADVRYFIAGKTAIAAGLPLVIATAMVMVAGTSARQRCFVLTSAISGVCVGASAGRRSSVS